MTHTTGEDLAAPVYARCMRSVACQLGGSSWSHARRLLALIATACVAAPAADGSATAAPARAAAATCPNGDLIPTTPAHLPLARAALLCELNVVRRARGLRPLRANAELRKAAERHSRAMVRERFFGHVGRDGVSLRTRVRRHTTYLRNTTSSTLAENVGWGSGIAASPADQVATWLLSASHRRVIFGPRYRDVGIGIVLGTWRPTSDPRAATYTTDLGVRSFT